MAAIKFTKADGIIASVIVLGVAAIAITLFAGPISRDHKEKAEKRAAVEERTKNLIEAKAAIVTRLRDPTSPVFTNVRISQIGDLTPTAICGEVNGKNGFGAYAGSHRFLYIPNSNLPVIDDGEERQLFDHYWPLLGCDTARAPLPSELVEGTEVNTDLTPK
jgi:hypothetical protein